VTGGKKLGKESRAEIELGYESVSMDNLDAGAPPEIMKDKGTFSKPYVAFSYSVDKRDEPFVPSEGYLAKLTAEIAAGDISTAKLTGEVEKHWTLWNPEGWGKHILTIKGTAGVMESYSGDRVPVFERFYAGGVDSFRGFALRGVSPVEPVKQEQVGGESMLVGSLEYSLPLMKDGLRLVGFVDAGYVKENAQDLLSGLDVLRVSTGVGVRWRIAALGNALLSAYLGIPVKKQNFDKTQAFQFTVGISKPF
jgi:outer membrane protein insertion porin family